jgi:hypothetical protein
MYIELYVKYPLFLSDFNETCIFSADFRKMFKYKIQGKSFQRGAEMLHAERRTDMILTVALRSFASARILRKPVI